MIPADHWHDNGDGTAWVVDVVGGGAYGWAELDTPCDTCGHWDPDDLAVALCPDCDGTGRHTFDIEVECGTYGDDHIGGAKGTGRCPHDPSCDGGVRTLRVSVVPGMVLPISDDPDRNDAYIMANDDSEHFIYYPAGWWDAPYPRGDYGITLPPAVQPGMWAVRLLIHTPENVDGPRWTCSCGASFTHGLGGHLCSDNGHLCSDNGHREVRRIQPIEIEFGPESVEPLCDVCNDTGFVDDLDNDGASVRCEWCPTPENVEELK